MRVFTVLAAAVLTLSVASPAAAEDEEWERIPCFKGAIDLIEVDADDNVTLAGHLDCSAEPSKGDPDVPTFGYARYDSGGVAEVSVVDLRAYGPTAPTTFSETWPAYIPQDPFGVCVVTDYEVRVACVKVSWVQRGAHPQVEPLATDDPLVDHIVKVVGDRTGNPVCAYC